MNAEDKNERSTRTATENEKKIDEIFISILRNVKKKYFIDNTRISFYD